MPTLGNALDFAKYEGRNLRAHQLGTSPATPVTGQLYYNTADNTLYWWDGSAWVSARGGVSTTPPSTTGSLGTIQLAGDLAGTATSPQIAAGVITDADVNAANKDGAVGTPSLRTLGSGANQAAPGNDARFGSGGPPTGTASGDLSGTYPSPQIAAGVIVDADVNAANKDGAIGTYSMRTIGLGAQQAMAGNTRLDTIAAPTGDVSLNSRKLIAVADPVAGTDGANKQYVDNTAQGLDAKASVRAASIANLTLSATQTVDGIALIVGDRVLVKDQSTPSQNGVYIVAAGAWTRATDMDTWAEIPSAYVWVELGTNNVDTGWVCTADQGGTINTTSIPWTQFAGAGSVVAGNGLTKSGNTLDVQTGQGLTITGDAVQVANNGITNAMMADGSVNLASADVTGTLPLTGGGTGQTTAKTARETGIGAAGYFTSATHAASATIVITAATHGLRASRGLFVQVQDEATGAVEIPDIVVAANGDITITYGASVSANSKRVTVIG